MEKEVRQRERHQEAFRRERKRAVAHLERDIAADERVDSLRAQDREFIPRLCYQCLKCGIVQGWFTRRGSEHSVLCRLYRAARMMCDRNTLDTQRQHVRSKSRLDDFGGIDALLAEMREALVKETPDGAENLQAGGDGCVVQRKNQCTTLP